MQNFSGSELTYVVVVLSEHVPQRSVCECTRVQMSDLSGSERERIRGGRLPNALLSAPVSKGGRLSRGSGYFSILGEQDITQNTRQVSLSLW